MEYGKFEQQLKKLASTHEMPVHDSVFEEVIRTRAQRKKRKKLLWWFIPVMGIGIMSLVYVLANQSSSSNLSIASSQTAIKSTEKLLTESENQLQHANPINQSALPKREKEIKESGAKYTTSDNDFVHKHNRVQSHNIVRSKKVIAKQKNASRQFESGVYSSSQEKLSSIKLASAQRLNPASQGESQQIISITDSNKLTNETKKRIDTISDEFVKTNTDTLNTLTHSTSLTSTQPQQQLHSWRVFAQFGYHPILQVKNQNNHLPFGLSDSLGLTNQAHSAYSIQFGMGYTFHKNLTLMMGIGFYQMNFDQIVTTDVFKDSSFNEQFGNGPLTSNANSYIADYRLRSLEVPLLVEWRMSDKSIHPYLRGGVIYQYLYQTSSYVFDITNNTNMEFAEKRNHEFNRFQQHQVYLTAEFGLSYQIHKKLDVQLGLHNRLTSARWYKNEAARNYYFGGVNACIQYKF